ncbi:MAG: flavodoxin [Candidatus Omnitrophica bacterium]|nr:flavodoxin [Candidatus Omnitrophota bacterium]
MAKILVLYHSQGGNTKAAAKLLTQGAEEAGIKVALLEARRAEAQDLLRCEGIAFGSPDYFNYIAGGLKDFFDRTFYPTQGKITGKPYVAFITHGGGGKAKESIELLCRIFKFKKIADTLLIEGRPDDTSAVQLKDLGKKLAEAIR